MLLVAIAGLLRLPTLGSESLWYDETFTAWIAKLPLDRLWVAVRGDVHPPLWYLVEWVTVRLFGSSETALRLPAALFGILAVLLIWQIALHLNLSPRTALVAGLLAATLPGILYYGQEARMYSLLEFGVCLALLEGLRKKWGGYIVGCLIAMYAQNLGVVYVGVLTLGMVWRWWRVDMIGLPPRELIHFIKHFGLARRIVAADVFPLALPFLLWLPWLMVGVIPQMQVMSTGFWLMRPDAGALATPLDWMMFGQRLPVALVPAIYWLTWVATAIGLVASRAWLKSPEGIVILIVMVGAPLALAMASTIWRSVYLYRAMIPSSALLCIAWACLLTAIKPVNRHVAIAALAPALIVSLGYYYTPGYGRSDLRGKLAPIAANFRPGDILVFGDVDAAIEFGYYLPGKPYVLMPGAGDYNQQLNPDALAAFGLIEGDFSNLCRQGYMRAWLIVAENPLTGAKEYAYNQAILALPHTLFQDYVSDHSMPTRIESDLVGTCETSF